jgi:AAA ATPase domain
MTVIEVSDRLCGTARQRTSARLPELAAPRGRTGVFPRRGQAHQPWELEGRAQELALIGAFVDELPAHGGALLLSGEPGIGKSALLDAAEETAAIVGIRVLRAAGVEFEDASFCGLNQLLLPLRGDLGQLDERQRNALNAALGFSDGPAGNRLLVSNAALALMLQAAADRPLLLIIDDLHWVDQASARVLGFVARRLRDSGVGLIAAERTGVSPHAALDVPGYEVRPLDDDASARLVATRFPGLAPIVRQRIVTEARGNSLALLELPVGLSDRQRSALAPLPAVLPLSGRLAAQLRDQPKRRAWHLAGAAIEPDGGAASLLVQVPRRPQDRGDGSQARRLATAAYLAASVLGDLGAAEALLADARRACPGPLPSAETAFATAFVLLHGDGDVATAHRLLLRGMETACGGGAGPLNVEEALEILATLCRVSGRADHRESLERLIAESGSAVPVGAHAAVRRPLEPGAASGRPAAEIESLAKHIGSAEIVRIASASALADRLPDCRQALRLVARSEPAASAGTSAMQASILLALEAFQTGQWDEAWPSPRPSLTWAPAAAISCCSARRRPCWRSWQRAAVTPTRLGRSPMKSSGGRHRGESRPCWPALITPVPWRLWPSRIFRRPISRQPESARRGTLPRASPAPGGRCSISSRPRCAQTDATMPSRGSKPSGRRG